jgi:hypothetical protein
MSRIRSSRKKQQGVVAIIVGLTLVVLVAFAGLALDGGQLYVSKTEQQNAADACALAASYELAGNPIPVESFTRATNAGVSVATQNKVGFQGTTIPAGDVEVTFSSSLTGAWVPAGSNPGGNAKYVRCTVARDGIAMWFMQVLGFGDQTVNALATASLAPAQTNCAIPMALCADAFGGSAPNYGYVRGQWYSMNFSETGGGNGVSNLTGNFRWIDFDPSAGTPGCSGGGAQELACLFKGAGQCNLPAPNPTAVCGSGSGTVVPGCVGQTGNINSLGFSFNTRFGIYHGSDNETTAPPDFTGRAFTPITWPLGHDAYDGSSTGNNFLAARVAYDPVQSSEVPPGSSAVGSSVLQSNGADRRLVTVPLVNCSSFTGTQQAPIQGYACIMLTRPYKKTGSNVIVTAEYLGRSNVPGSPCATSGSVGNTTSQGPMVPALVQ